MKKKSFAALAVALVTGGFAAKVARSAIYTPTAVSNGDFDYDATVATPLYTYNYQLANWYRASAAVRWSAQSFSPISGGSGPAYADLQGDGDNAGEIFQSIGTFSPNFNVSISLLESYVHGATGSSVTVSLYSGGIASTTYSTGYGTGYDTYNLSNATLLGFHKIADNGTQQFNLSTFTINTGTSGSKGQTLWLDISTNDSSLGDELAIDNVVATGSTTLNLTTWKATRNNTWDSTTSNFENSSGGSIAFSNGADALFDDTVSASNATISLAGNLSPSTITFNNSANTFSLIGSGSITGGTSLTKNGAGAVILATANSFTGPVTINAGSIILENAAGLGTSQNVTVSNRAMLGFQTSCGAVTINNEVSIAGNGPSGQGSLVNISGTNTLNGDLYLPADATINVSTGSLNLIGNIYGTGGLTKTGSGTLIISALNYYTGDTNVDGGSIVSSGYDSFAGTNLNVESGASVVANANGVVVSTNLNVNGGSFVSNSSGAIQSTCVKLNSGTITCNYYGSLTNGTVNVGSGGNLVLTVSFADEDSTLNINSGGEVTASGGDAIGYGGSRVQRINIAGGTFDIADDGSEGFDTIWTLTNGTMSSTGGGAYNFDADSASEIIVNLNASTSVISGNMNLRDDNGAGSLFITVASGAASGIDLNISGNITGNSDSTLDKEGRGTLALTGLNTFSGPVIVGSGILMIGNGTSGHDGAINSAVTITDRSAVVFNTFSAQSFGGNITGNGTVSKLGQGTLTLTGSNTYFGGTNVSSGTLIFASADAFSAFTALTLNTGGTAVAANHGSAAKYNIYTNSLSISGTTGGWSGLLDLTNNDMIVRGGNLSVITSQIAEGYDCGYWQGSGGITSSAAAANPKHLTALGVITNDDGTDSNTPLYTTFDGTTVVEGDVLVKYTYYGDTDLDGRIDGSDYSRIDSAALSDISSPGSATGWFNGDFNYDGVVNGSDYTLIDNSYNTQGPLISAEVVSPTAQVLDATIPVPEPATAQLLGLTAIGVLATRRRYSV